MALTLIMQSRTYRRLAAPAIDATGLNTSDSFDVSDTLQGTFQIVHAAHTAGTSTWELQSSLDGTNYDTITGTSTATSGVAGSKTYTVDPLPGGKIRLKVTVANGSVAPTLTVYFEGKRAR